MNIIFFSLIQMEKHKLIKNIIFYEENREGQHNGGTPPKYVKYKIPISEISGKTDMGFGGETKLIHLSNGKIIITNNLWMMFQLPYLYLVE